MDQNPEEIAFLGQALDAAACRPSYVGEKLADFVRKLMSASMSMEPTGHAFMAFVDALDHLQGFDNNQINESLKIARDSLSIGNLDDEAKSAAVAGTRYLMALSMNDSYASARQSAARSRFLDEMRCFRRD